MKFSTIATCLLSAFGTRTAPSPSSSSSFFVHAFSPTIRTTSKSLFQAQTRTIHVSNTCLKSSGGETKSMAEKVLLNPQWPAEWPYTEQDLARMDESQDTIFYESPRLCYHIDDFAVDALTKYYKENIKDGEDVLDICSSWVSHYPKDFKGGNVVGLGMNEFELSQNPQLSSYNVKDLNVDPTFPYDDASFDKLTCVVSVDYLTKPKEIFAEIGRVLRPGGVAMLAISNRCFPTKAWNLWLRTNDLEHVFIAGSFFHYSGLFEPPSCDDISPNPGRSDPMFIIKATRK